jgi:hypothetical protein
LFVSHAEIGGSGGHVEIEPLGAYLRLGVVEAMLGEKTVEAKLIRRLWRIPKMDTVKILLI